MPCGTRTTDRGFRPKRTPPTLSLGSLQVLQLEFEPEDAFIAVQVDLLLVDLEMPRMNGLELTHHVRANDETRDVPVIMITSRSTDKHRQQAKAAGVTQYLTKPYVEDELMEHVYAVCTK